MRQPTTLESILDTPDKTHYDIRTRVPGPSGSLPITPDMLLTRSSGDLFGWSQNAGMGWDPSKLGGHEVLILSTHGGLRGQDGEPIALGYHTGHFEVNLLVEAAARELAAQGAVPFAGYCTDPCDGRSQGTPGMFDSLPYRNDAAVVLRRLIRSLPNRRGVIGVATCDKGLPAMMMALAAMRDLPTILAPGGVTLAAEGGEDSGKAQTLGARFAHGEVSLEYAAEAACRTCATPGGGCQFLGTAATSQVVGEALGLSLPHSALAPSGHPIWTDIARRSAAALLRMIGAGRSNQDVLTPAAVNNAMAVHAAFGGSTNLILHLPAIAHSAGLTRPSVADWARVNRAVPRLVDVLPNGPRSFITAQVFLAGAVPEVMLHLRRAGLIDTKAMTVAGQSWDQLLDWWEQSERRFALRKQLLDKDRVDPANVIMDPDSARKAGLTSTICFPVGNLAPQGSVVKSTSIDPSVVDSDGVYRKTGPAKVFVSEKDAIAAIKGHQIQAGDIMVLMCRGALGSGMEETYQITSALKHLPFGKHVALVTDARFSGVSTGACVGHVSPEALAGGPLAKVRTGDMLRIVIDRTRLEATIDLVGESGSVIDAAEGDRLLAMRTASNALRPDPLLPPETRLWAALQEVSGGVWGGAVYDVDAILRTLEAGKKALAASE
jgi:putative YjhG/YagF family dehydratase